MRTPVRHVDNPRLSALTGRELNVPALVSRGLSIAEIAADLDVSPATEEPRQQLDGSERRGAELGA